MSSLTKEAQKLFLEIHEEYDMQQKDSVYAYELLLLQQRLLGESEAPATIWIDFERLKKQSNLS